ncbi:hypothetical protein FACS1894211_10560 [Clostridia bacterium]|nr:hypothetical protein FACS1894211_10560 [Clostridia bacterium]
MERNEARLREIYHAGAMPFAMLYQPLGLDKKVEYGADWKAFQRQWTRPAAVTAHMRTL